MNYGVLPTGFSRKPLAVILAEVESQLITEFGPDVIQTSQSPLGQLNGLFSDLIAELWEVAEDVYQSYDPNQAEGARLDILGAIRLLRRSGGESDAAYRRAISNEDTARIGMADLLRALAGLDGVTYSQVFVNDDSEADANGLPGHSVAAVVIGGDDLDVATVLTRYVTPGISTTGNYRIESDIDGYCRTVFVTRPLALDVQVEIRVRKQPDQLGCPAPSPSTIAAAVLNYATAPQTRPKNGALVSPYYFRSFIESTFPAVEYVGYTATIPERGQTYSEYMSFIFSEIANITEVSVVME